jgi:hypothetical protein
MLATIYIIKQIKFKRRYDMSLAKRVSISFSTKKADQELLNYLESKKDDVGISDFIKSLIRKDLESQIKEEN